MRDSQFMGNCIPVVVLMSRTYDNLELGVCAPQLANGLNAIPTRRHAYVNKGQGVRSPRRLGSHNEVEPLLPLKGRIHLKLRSRLPSCAEQQVLVGAQLGVVVLLQQDFFEIVMDGFVVIDDEQTVTGRRVCHAVALSAALLRRLQGSSSVKTAPQSVPSLSAVSAPPSSRAARALECSPKPWPSCLVVKP